MTDDGLSWNTYPDLLLWLHSCYHNCHDSPGGHQHKHLCWRLPGAAHQAVAACLRGQCQPLMGTALFAGYEDMIGRPELFEPCRLNLAGWNELLVILLVACIWTRIYFAWRPICRTKPIIICWNWRWRAVFALW